MGMDPITLSAAIGGAVALATTAATVVPPLVNPQKPPTPPTISPALVGPDQATLNKQLIEAENKTQRQASAAKGRSGTILTSPLGSSDNSGNQATLLGQ